MRQILYSIILIFALTSCKDEAVPDVRPDLVLEQDKFTEVMVDMQLIQAMYTRQLPLDTAGAAKAHAYRYYQEVFEKHGINQADFDTSYVWYVQHKPLMLEVYEDVLERLATIAEE